MDFQLALLFFVFLFFALEFCRVLRFFRFVHLYTNASGAFRAISASIALIPVSVNLFRHRTNVSTCSNKLGLVSRCLEAVGGNIKSDPLRPSTQSLTQSTSDQASEFSNASRGALQTDPGQPYVCLLCATRCVGIWKTTDGIGPNLLMRCARVFNSKGRLNAASPREACSTQQRVLEAARNVDLWARTGPSVGNSYVRWRANARCHLPLFEPLAADKDDDLTRVPPLGPPPLFQPSRGGVHDDAIHERHDHRNIARACSRHRPRPLVLRHAHHDEPDRAHKREHGGVAPSQVRMARSVPSLLHLVGSPGGASEDNVFGEDDGDEGSEPVADETLLAAPKVSTQLAAAAAYDRHSGRTK